MIEKLRSMAIFATVVDCNSFRAAADQLSLAPSRISQTVSDLEKELGVTLLYRSTRQLSLTNEGQILYNKVVEMLRAAETGLDAINLISNTPTGELRVTLPAFVTQTGMMDLFARFSKANPGIHLKLNFSDQPRDLIKEGFDLGIRAGMLQDSELMSRNIGQSERTLVASPAYIASREDANQPIEQPSDLESCENIHFSMRSERTELMSKSGETVSVISQSRIEVDSAQALYEFAIRGIGIAQIPEHLANRGFKQGELVRVLPDWSIKPLMITAVWPDRSRRESLTLILVRFLADRSERL